MTSSRARSVEHVAALIFIIVVAVVITVGVYIAVHGSATKTKGSASSYTHEARCIARIVAVKPRIGWVDVYVYSTCRARVDTVYFIDPVTRDVIVPAQLVYPVELQPGRITKLMIPLLSLGVNLTELNRPLALALGTSGGWSLVTGNWFNPYQPLEEAQRKAWMLLLADRYSLTGLYTYDHWYTHWVIFNFVTGEYYFYSYLGRPASAAEGPYHGYAPLVKDSSSFFVSCTWVSWSQRPIDSPVVIVFNPTRGLREWNFTWIEPHGVDVFVLPPVARSPDQVVYDFLVFWEDLWNPYIPPSSVDDWKDHVVRVTLYANGTVRLQVYIAKGGYLHIFRHETSLSDAATLGYDLCPSSPHCYNFCLQPQPNPLFDYCKPHGAFWASRVYVGDVYVAQCGTSMPKYIYYPLPGKVWYVPLGG